MDLSNQAQELLRFFKALSDANRLKIVALLGQQELSVEQIASLLDLRPSTVSHHLARLSEVGLVKARSWSYYNIYRLEPAVLENLSRRILAPGVLEGAVVNVDPEAFDQKILKPFLTESGRVKQFPRQRKKFNAVLRYVVKVFEPGQRYTEKQVNELLSQFNEDTALLRRELFEVGLMGREGGGGEYWRIPGATLDD